LDTPQGTKRTFLAWQPLDPPRSLSVGELAQFTGPQPAMRPVSGENTTMRPLAGQVHINRDDRQARWGADAL